MNNFRSQNMKLFPNYSKFKIVRKINYMGCTFDSGVNKSHVDKTHQNRHGRIGTIDTRKKSSKFVDKIIENVTVSNDLLNNAHITFAATCLQKQSFFNSLSGEQIKLISSLLISASAKKGECIFQQGDPGNCFFLIQNGEVQVQIDGSMIKTLTQGQTFGQMALILRTKRSATIRTKTDCKLLVMKPLLFRQAIQKMKTSEYEIKRNSIQQVEIFQGLTNKQKLSLSNALKIMVYQKGQRIIMKNQLANAFYIINEGKVVVQLPKHPDVFLTKSECFGESAFRLKGRRKGSVIAVERTVCSIISKDDFQKHSGTKAQNIYFYNMKKWALKGSQIFKNYNKYTLNAINLAFQTQFAQSHTRIRNDGLVICLQGRINEFPEGQGIFGQKQWKQNKQKSDIQLTQQVEGYYGYLSFQKLNKLLADISKKRQSKQLALSIIASNKQNFGSIDLSSFQYIKDLGEGQFGAVKLVKDVTMQRLYALKQISKESIKKQGLQNYIQEERKILQKIQFPYIVGFVKAFSDQENVYFLMEYIKGVQLFNVIRQMPSLNKPIARYFFASLLLAIQHLHSHSIIYRDIKPENSVVDHTGKCHLIDMGTAKFLRKQKSYRTFTIIGTPHYMAPQVFNTQGYSFESDIWSLGVLMYEFLCNELPFGQNQQDTYTVMEIIKKQKVKYSTKLQPESQQLLKMMLNKDFKQRSISGSFDKIKEAAFFKGFNWQDMSKQKVFPPYIPKQFKKQGGNKTLNMEGKPLVKVLYPSLYAKGHSVDFKQWNQRIAF